MKKSCNPKNPTAQPLAPWILACLIPCNRSQVDKQLEAELREMHAVVSDQQKRLDALTLENERLRQELHDRHQAWFTKETVATDRTRKLVIGREPHQIQYNPFKYNMENTSEIGWW